MTPKSKPAPDTAKGLAAKLIPRFTTPAHARRLARLALEEDIGPGDLTQCIFPPAAKGAAILLAKADGVLSGTALASATFAKISKRIKIDWHFKNGDAIRAGDAIARLDGPMAALLNGERVALNFLQHMSGVATLTRQFVDTVGAGKNKPGIYDTRKTTPLLRAFEKQAVLDGGGKSHRFALYDMAMLKDNHIDAAGGISEAVSRLKEDGFFKKRPRLGLCIEVRSIDEAVEATWCGANVIMLDNMTPAQIKKAAEAVAREAKLTETQPPDLEISGGIMLKNLKRYSALPVQRISVGALTHSAPALDISMKYVDPT